MRDIKGFLGIAAMIAASGLDAGSPRYSYHDQPVVAKRPKKKRPHKGSKAAKKASRKK